MSTVDPTSKRLVIGDRRPIVVPSRDIPGLSWVILRCTAPSRCAASVSFHSSDTTSPHLGAPLWVYELGWRITDVGWLCPAHPDPPNLEEEPVASTPGPAADLIDHAARIIVAEMKKPHTAPYHWAGALWKAGMLVAPGTAPGELAIATFTPGEVRAMQERRDNAG